MIWSLSIAFAGVSMEPLATRLSLTFAEPELNTMRSRIMSSGSVEAQSWTGMGGVVVNFAAV